MEPQIWELILREVREGFESVASRLDMINGTVRRHGEQIAVLEKQAVNAEDTALRNGDKIDKMNHEFLVHRAKCPFDAGASTAPGSADDAVLAVARRIRRQQAATFASIGGAAAIALLEFLPRILDWLLKNRS